MSLKSNSYFGDIPTPKKGTHHRISGRMFNAKHAYAVGYRYAIVSPKGHPVSFHMTDQQSGTGFYSLHKAGCKIVRLELLL